MVIFNLIFNQSMRLAPLTSSLSGSASAHSWYCMSCMPGRHTRCQCQLDLSGAVCKLQQLQTVGSPWHPLKPRGMGFLALCALRPVAMAANGFRSSAHNLITVGSSEVICMQCSHRGSCRRCHGSRGQGQGLQDLDQLYPDGRNCRWRCCRQER